MANAFYSKIRSMSHQTCQANQEVLDKIKELRFRKDKTNACLILKIDPKELLVILDEYMDNTDLNSISEALPSTTPRFLVISYELKHKDGRISYPLTGIYYNPEGASTSNKMLYASSTSLIFHEAGIVGKVFDLQNGEDLSDEWLVQRLESSKTRP